MSSLAEKGVRILDAAADVEDLLRLAHEAVHRIHQDVSNEGFDLVEDMSEKMHHLRAEAKRLNTALQDYVREMESTSQVNVESQESVRKMESTKL